MLRIDKPNNLVRALHVFPRGWAFDYFFMIDGSPEGLLELCRELREKHLMHVTHKAGESCAAVWTATFGQAATTAGLCNKKYRRYNFRISICNANNAR